MTTPDQPKDDWLKPRKFAGRSGVYRRRSRMENGMERVLGILAWNGGAHANPTFAGDTIYAYSEILDKSELPGRTGCGALRARLVGLKDVRATEAGFPLMVEQDGRQVYHEDVVLDLDYWLLVPKRAR